MNDDLRLFQHEMSRRFAKGVRLVELRLAGERGAHAVHESGHALAAWSCVSVFMIEHATIDKDGASEVHYLADPGSDWCRLVIDLAGIAAETLVFGTGRGARASSDLRMALDRVRKIRTPPPWPVPAGKSLPFHRMFRDGIDDTEAETLSIAFRMASHVLVEQEARLQALTDALLRSSTLHHQQLAAVLGDRTGLRKMATSHPQYFFAPRAP